MVSMNPMLHFFEFDPSYVAKERRFTELLRPVSVQVDSKPGLRPIYIVTFMECPFENFKFDTIGDSSSKRKFYILTIQNEIDSDIRIIPLYISKVISMGDEYIVEFRLVWPHYVGPFKKYIEGYVKENVFNRRSPNPSNRSRLYVHHYGKHIDHVTFDEFIGGSTMPFNSPFMPAIKNVYFTDPYTTVEWADDTKTTVKCKDGETFDKETGLAMAIAKRYFKKFDPEHPRKKFKKAVNDANDMSKKVAAKRAYKAEKKAKNQNPATEE